MWVLACAQVVLAVQLVLCLSCASASLHWRQAQGFSRYHLALDNFSQGAQPRRMLCQCRVLGFYGRRYHHACTLTLIRSPCVSARRQARHQDCKPLHPTPYAGRLVDKLWSSAAYLGTLFLVLRTAKP